MADDEKTLTLVLKARNLANREIGRLHSGLDKIGSKATAAGKLAAKGLAIAGVGVAGLVTAAALAAPKIFDMSASLELMAKKVQTVFGKDEAGDVKDWADQVAERMGLTSAKLQGLAANFGDLLVPMGFTRKQAREMSTDVVGLSGALSEWSGGQRSAEEVADILSKAMLGERDALKGLGISITEEDVKQRLLKKGQEDLTGAALAQARAVATQELIFERSKDAQAAYAKGAGTLLARQNALRAKFDQAVETIVTRVTPALVMIFEWVANKVVPAVGEFIGKVERWISENRPLINQLSNFAKVVLANVVKWIGKVIDVFGELITNITSNKDIMNALRVGADLIAKAFRFVADAIGFTIDRIADLIDWIVKAIEWIGKLNLVTSRSQAEHVAHQTGQPLPGHATGGWVGLNGPELAMVGEQGPEFIQRRHMAMGGNGAPSGGGDVYLDGEKVGRVLYARLSRQMFYELQRSAPTLSRV